MKRVSLVIMLLFISCDSSKQILSSTQLNTVYNSKYKKSVETFYGELNEDEYKKVRKEIELELSVTIPKGNSILINFKQNGHNCMSMNDNGIHYLKSLEVYTEYSSRISSKNHASDFFVFAKDSFFKELITMGNNYVADSGFFYNNVFNIHENCSAFFIIKPNGKFLKHYGGDYFSKVKTFLEVE